MMTTLLLLSSLALSAPDAETLQTIWAVEASRGDVAPLLPLLDHEDHETRARATLALARLRDPQNLDVLVDKLKDWDPQVRQAAAFGLGLTEGGAPAVREALATEADEQVRARLLESLGMQPHADNLPVLVAALSEGAAAQGSAAKALGQHGMAKIEGVQSSAVLEALTKVLRGNWLDPEPRVRAAFAMARIAPTELPRELQTELLDKADRDRSATVRAFLVRALSTATAGDTANKMLSAAASDADRGVRIAAARAIGEVGTEAELPLMQALLLDWAWDVQLAAVQASAKMEAMDHLAALSPFLKPGTPVDLQSAAISALGQVGEHGPLRPFLDKDQPTALRVAAIGTLDDPEQLMRLLERAELPALRSAVAGRLVELDVSPEIAAQLLDNEDPAVRAVGISMLGESEDPRWIADILGVMTDAEDLDVLREGLGALDTLLGLLPARTPAPAAAAELIELALQHPSVSVRAAAQGPAARVGVSAQAPAPVVPHASDIEGIIGARFITDSGELWIEFETELAPMTVWNFVQLAEADAFDGNNFHRVLPDFVIQDGCPRGDGWGGPGYSIVDELSWLPYDEGTLGMALSGPDTGGSQWFLTLAPQPHLDGGYTVFGHLVGGTSHAVHQGTVIVDVIIERAP